MRYALKDGEFISIEKVPSGSRCGCTCPEYGEALIARKGDVRVHHFAHKDDSSCSLGSNGSKESFIHWALKECLLDWRGKDITIERGYLEVYYESNILFERFSQQRIIPLTLHVNDVILESSYSGIRPDAILKTQLGDILVSLGK